MSARIAITGGSGGIGSAAAELLRSRGASVALLDLNATDEVIACDVRDQDSVDRAIASAIDRLGGLDVLVNSAGIGIPQSAGEKPDADALAVIDINLLGTWRATAAALPELLRSRGRVINIASGLAHVTVPLAPAYTASKRAVVGYSDSLRLEYGTELGAVTTIYPGYIKTPIHAAAADRGVALEGVVPEEPLSAAAEAITRAALGDRLDNLATTRRGTVSYAIVDRLPRRWMRSATLAHMRRMTKKGVFGGAGLSEELGRRVSGRS